MNINEIAKMAGVSKAAVSRYLNQGYLSEEKSAAIRKVVEATGYRPSVQAQTLRTNKSRMIGVIVPKIASASIGKVVEGILSVTNVHGYQMLLAVTQNDQQKELEYLISFAERRVDAIILVATIFTEEYKRRLKEISVPVVIVGQRLEGYSCVFHDDYHATYDLTRRVLEQGRHRVGYIGAILQDQAVGKERLRGYQDAARAMGQQDAAERSVVADFSMASGYEKAGELLKRYGALDAVICATDTMAAGAAMYLKEQGLSLPEEVLVAGQGESELSRVMTPPLLTVHYAYKQSGELAVRILLTLLQERNAARQAVCLGYRLVE